jgi:hypothetical protein
MFFLNYCLMYRYNNVNIRYVKLAHVGNVKLTCKKYNTFNGRYSITSFLGNNLEKAECIISLT